MTACCFTVWIYMCVIKCIDCLHNLNTEVICLLVVTKAALFALKLHQNIDTLCHADHTKHCGKTISVDEAFFCKEVALEKAALLHLKANALIHIKCHALHYIWKLIFEEVLLIFCTLCDIAKNQTAQRIGTTA